MNCSQVSECSFKVPQVDHHRVEDTDYVEKLRKQLLRTAVRGKAKIVDRFLILLLYSFFLLWCKNDHEKSCTLNSCSSIYKLFLILSGAVIQRMKNQRDRKIRSLRGLLQESQQEILEKEVNIFSQKPEPGVFDITKRYILS